MATNKKKIAGGVGGAVALILSAIVAVEGGFVDNPNDPGGKTKNGVTEKVARADGYTGPMQELPEDRALKILSTNYLEKPGLLPLVERSPALAKETADQVVNFGPHRPSCYFQRALNALNDRGRIYRNIKVDCRIGPATIAAWDALAAKRGTGDACRVMVKLMDAQQGVEYLRLSEVNAKLQTFTYGWARTRLGNVPLAECG